MDIKPEQYCKTILEQSEELVRLYYENEILKKRLEFIEKNLATSFNSWSNKIIAQSKEIK